MKLKRGLLFLKMNWVKSHEFLFLSRIFRGPLRGGRMGPPTGGMMEGLLVSNSPFLEGFLDPPLVPVPYLPFVLVAAEPVWPPVQESRAGTAPLPTPGHGGAGWSQTSGYWLTAVSPLSHCVSPLSFVSLPGLTTVSPRYLTNGSHLWSSPVCLTNWSHHRDSPTDLANVSHHCVSPLSRCESRWFYWLITSRWSLWGSWLTRCVSPCLAASPKPTVIHCTVSHCVSQSSACITMARVPSRFSSFCLTETETQKSSPERSSRPRRFSTRRSRNSRLDVTGCPSISLCHQRITLMSARCR